MTESSDTPMTDVPAEPAPSPWRIVLLAEEALSEHDAVRVSQLHEDRDVRIHLLVPVDTEHNVVEALDEVAMGRVAEAVRHARDVPREQAEAAARESLDRSLHLLREALGEADGALAPDDPVDLTVETAERLGADEVIVVTRPHPIEDAVRRDWASRVRKATHRPVLHFIAGTDWVS